MKTIRLLIYGFVAAMAAQACGGEAEPKGKLLRIAIAPPAPLEGRVSDAGLWAVAVSVWLQEALSAVENAEVVASERAALIFETVTSAAWLGADRDLRGAFSGYEPIDVLIVARPGVVGGELTVWKGEGTMRLTVERPTTERLRAAVVQAANFVADRLFLEGERRNALIAVPEMDGESLGVLFSAAQVSASWPHNPGEAKLIALQPVWKKYPSHPRVCAEVLRAVTAQLAAQRRDQSYTPTAVQIGRMALPPVLGTPYEESALALVRQDPAVFIPELERAVRDLMKQAAEGTLGAALDAVLEGRGSGEQASQDPSSVWVSGGYSRAQQLGAVRLLARVEDSAAHRTIQTLVRHPDPEVRGAAEPPRALTEGASDRSLSSAEALIREAQDPEEAVAAKARRLLQHRLPSDPWERTAFRLRIAHPLEREAIVERMGQDFSDRATALLSETAAENPDPHVRAKALRVLAGRDAGVACRLAGEALTRRPGHRLERLYAAAVFLDYAGADQVEAIRRLLAEEPEPAIREFLAAALARAEGRPLPPGGAAARKVGGARNLAWLCGMGLEAAQSPFDAYYLLSMPGDLERWRGVQAAGKIVFVRLTPIGHPGLAALNRSWRDRFWLALERELTPERVSLLDGIVLGEETMTMAPEGLWADGWFLFCEEMGLDPDRIRGEPAALTSAETQRWKEWAYEKSVEGFNRIVDFVRLRWRRERPGLQVCTFLPGEIGKTGPNIRRWQFDVVGIYDYKCDQRMAAFSLVRRLKTLWPDRPVLWLSLGIGGYEMNPVWFTHRAPERPLATRRIRAYADAVAAWLAGADTGWFSTWIFVAPRYQKGMPLRGVQVHLEDLFPESPMLERALAYAFQGAEEMEEIRGVRAPRPAEGLPVFEDEGAGEDIVKELAEALEGRDPEGDRRRLLAERKESLRRGFWLYRHYLEECARVFRSLPRLAEQGSAALAVHPGVSVWTTPTTPNPLVPGHALLNGYDFADDERQLVEPGTDLSRYRMILLHNPSSLEGAVGDAVLRWLRETEGILYLHRPGEMPAMPWGEEIECRKTGRAGGKTLPALSLQDEEGNSVEVKGAVLGAVMRVRGERSRVLFRRGGDAVLVLWGDPALYRGQVILDGVESASRDYLERLRAILKTVGGEAVDGLLDGPILHSVRKVGGVTAAACSGYYRDVSERVAYKGVDLLTGEANPEVGGGLSGALVADRFQSGHLHLEDGFMFLSEHPLNREVLQKTPGGWIWLGGGLLRVTRQGPLGVVPLEGPPLRSVAVEEMGRWLMGGKPTGVLILSPGSTDAVWRVYVRSEQPVRIEPLEGEER